MHKATLAKTYEKLIVLCKFTFDLSISNLFEVYQLD